ncbi:MAG: hypothetical protein GY910_00120 [bacterium]|nr:hypothetical protein [Deltaproteobacteria bacterium]MCP4903361.1 hypothetical protein [bacterium]
MPPPPRASRKNTAEARRKGAPDSEARRLIRLDGLAVRRLRHDRGWSPRDLVAAIEEACFNASGLRRTLTPNLIQSIEERAEQISYDELLLLADGLACDPSDLIAEGELSSRRPDHRLH